jgi:hypothetical protein
MHISSDSFHTYSDIPATSTQSIVDARKYTSSTFSSPVQFFVDLHEAKSLVYVAGCEECNNQFA